MNLEFRPAFSGAYIMNKLQSIGMAPPRKHNTEISLFVTATQAVHPSLLAEIHATAAKWAECEATLHTVVSDSRGGSFSGKSPEELAVWVAYTFGGDDSSRRASGAFVVLDDEGVAQRYVLIAALDMDWPEHFSREQIAHAFERNQTLPGLLKDTVKVDFKYAIDIPTLLDADWKGIEFYKQYAEEMDGNTGVLRRQEGEIDPDGPLPPPPGPGGPIVPSALP